MATGSGVLVSPAGANRDNKGVLGGGESGEQGGEHGGGGGGGISAARPRTPFTPL